MLKIVEFAAPRAWLVAPLDIGGCTITAYKGSNVECPLQQQQRNTPYEAPPHTGHTITT
jgi:hypothetical protein